MLVNVLKAVDVFRSVSVTVVVERLVSVVVIEIVLVDTVLTVDVAVA